jgi:5'-deoxynucleotidase YfbR-like HD superfamily hydrolase
VKLRRPNRVEVICLAVGTAAASAAVLASRASAMPAIVPLLLFGTLFAFAENQIVVVANRTSVSASFMVAMAAVVVFRAEHSLIGPMLVGACGAFYIPHFRTFDWRKIVFNLGNYSLAVLTAAVTFAALPHSGSGWVPTMLLLSVPTTLASSLLDIALLTLVVSAASGRPGRSVLRDFGPTYAHIYPFAVLGVFMGRLYLQIGPSSVLLFIVPIVIARHTFKSYIDLKAAHEATIRILIRALEAKDAYTAGHAERVAQFALYIGSELNLSPMRLERLRLAALMHDVGKLIVPNHLLNKPGRLTAEEYARVRQHEFVSMEILTRIDFLAPVAPSASSEHSRFAWVSDKNGQPIEPHIVAVADAFDAMTSTRSYRRALTQSVAFDELRKNAARQFHPRVVEALIAGIERRGEHYGAGYEATNDHWETPPPVAGTGSAGLGDLVPEAQRVASEGPAA